jgi:hypothetical protein
MIVTYSGREVEVLGLSWKSGQIIGTYAISIKSSAAVLWQ